MTEELNPVEHFVNKRMRKDAKETTKRKCDSLDPIKSIRLFTNIACNLATSANSGIMYLMHGLLEVISNLKARLTENMFDNYTACCLIGTGWIEETREGQIAQRSC